jgi:hypothetical protein
MVSKLTNLVEAFGQLNMHQAGRFSEVLLCKLESQVEGPLFSKTTGATLDEKDVRDAIVDTLCSIAVDVNKQQQIKTNALLADQLNGMFAGHLVAA